MVSDGAVRCTRRYNSGKGQSPGEPEPCHWVRQAMSSGDKETRRQGSGDKETGRQGDKETEPFAFHSSVSLSPCLLVSLSVNVICSRTFETAVWRASNPACQ